MPTGSHLGRGASLCSCAVQSPKPPATLLKDVPNFSIPLPGYVSSQNRLRRNLSQPPQVVYLSCSSARVSHIISVRLRFRLDVFKPLCSSGLSRKWASTRFPGPKCARRIGSRRGRAPACKAGDSGPSPVCSTHPQMWRVPMPRIRLTRAGHQHAAHSLHVETEPSLALKAVSSGHSKDLLSLAPASVPCPDALSMAEC